MSSDNNITANTGEKQGNESITENIQNTVTDTAAGVPSPSKELPTDTGPTYTNMNVSEEMQSEVTGEVLYLKIRRMYYHIA